MKKLLLIGVMLIGLQAQASEVMVSAEGFGEDYDWAVLNAVENAVRQTSDITVENTTGLKKIDARASQTKEKIASDSSSFSNTLDGKTTGDFNIDAKGTYTQQYNHQSIEGERIVQEIKDNSKEIPAKYKGVVSSYQVVGRSEENGKVHVVINALVFKECRSLPHCSVQKADCSCYLCEKGYKSVGNECLPCEDKDICGCSDGKRWSKEKQECYYDSHDYSSKDLVKKSKYSLAVLPFKAKKNFTCTGQKIPLDEINGIISNLYEEKLAPTRRFNLLDRNNFDSYNKELSLITDDMTLQENQVKLKNIVSADYILVGSIDNFTASTTKKTLEMTGEVITNSTASLKLSYKILETATMEIISTGSVSKNFSKKGNFSSCFNIENHLFEQAIEESSQKLLSDIFEDYKTPQKEEKTNISQKKTSGRRPPEPTSFKLPFDD